MQLYRFDTLIQVRHFSYKSNYSANFRLVVQALRFTRRKGFSPMYDSVDPGIIQGTVYTTNLGWSTFTYVKVVLSLFPSPAPIVPMVVFGEMATRGPFASLTNTLALFVPISSSRVHCRQLPAKRSNNKKKPSVKNYRSDWYIPSRCSRLTTLLNSQRGETEYKLKT